MKIECNVTESTQYDYWANIEITFNGKNIVNIVDDDLLDELAEEIDDIYDSEGHYEWKQGCIHREVSKYHFDEDEYYKEERKEIEGEFCEIARDKLTKQFSRNLRVFSQYGENVEQLFEGCNISDIALVTDDNLHQFLIDEGIIDEN